MTMQYLAGMVFGVVMTLFYQMVLARLKIGRDKE